MLPRAKIIGCVLLVSLTTQADGTASGLPGLPGRAGGSSSSGVSSVTATAPVVSSGGATPDISLTSAVPLQTIAVATYFVDPTGNNSNACTSSGASACSTLTGALAKVPFIVNNVVTINIAAGTYAETPTFNGFLNGAGAFDIVGPALTGFTVATGANTGTLTAVTLTQPTSFTDSGQTWTTDDLKGAFLVMTSGAASGQILPILANTATVVTVGPSVASTIAIGDTYQIRIPAASFTSAGTALTVQMIGSTPFSGTQGRIRFTGLDFSGVTNGCLVSGGAYQTSFVGGSRCRGTTGVGLQVNGGTINLANIIALATTGVAASFGNLAGTASGSAPYVASVNRVDFISGARAVVLYQGVWTVQVGSAGLRGNPTSIQGVLEVRGAASQVGSNSVVLALYCDSAAGAGIMAQDPQIAPIGQGGSNQNFTGYNFYASGCAKGLAINGKSANINFVSNTETTTCNNIATTCVEVSNGSNVRIPTSAVITGTSPTNEIMLETTAYTFATLNAASPKQITDALSGSSVSMR